MSPSNKLPVGADLGAFDPVVQANLGLALDVVALVVEDTDVELFAAELTLDPEVETATENEFFFCFQSRLRNVRN